MDRFKTALTEYNNAKNNFGTDDYQNIINFLNQTPNNDYDDVVDVDSTKYLRTKDRILIEIDGSVSESFTSLSLLPTIDYKDKIYEDDSTPPNYYYVSNETISATVVNNNIKPNSVYQIGLFGEFTQGNFDISSQLCLDPTQEFNNLDISQESACDETFAYKCQSRALIQDKNSFALVGKKDATENCQCYIFDEVQSDEIKCDPVHSIEINQIHTTNLADINGISYLGVLLDGNIYALKDTNYSGNFSDSYNINDNAKMFQITNNSSDLGINCHPIVGKSLNNITINSLDKDNNCQQ